MIGEVGKTENMIIDILEILDGIEIKQNIIRNKTDTIIIITVVIIIIHPTRKGLE